MHPMAMHDLARIRQSEYLREAENDRLAKAAKASKAEVSDDRVERAAANDRVGILGAIVSLFRPTSHTAKPHAA
jgi:hypothetical protein